MFRRFISVLSLVVLCSVYCFSQKDYEVNIENDAVHRYMEEVNYVHGQESVLSNYLTDEGKNLDCPAGIVIDLPRVRIDTLKVICYVKSTLSDTLSFFIAPDIVRASLYNFIPNETYEYKIYLRNLLLQQGTIKTEGQVRMIRVDGTVKNVRDLGGWPTITGQRIKYGKLIRGSELNWEHNATAEGLNMLRQIGVEAEIDMRAHWEAIDKSGNHPETEGVSVFGFQNAASTPSGETATYLYTKDSGQLPENLGTYQWQNKWKQEFDFIVNNLIMERCIYYHCIQGKDRTGYLSLLLEGLLGVEYSDLIKDYELSYFSFKSESKKNEIDEVIAYINKLSGETLRDKFNTYFITKIRARQADINYFRLVMLDGEADEGGIITKVDERVAKSNKHAISDLSGRRIGNKHLHGLYLMNDGQGGYRKMFLK